MTPSHLAPLAKGNCWRGALFGFAALIAGCELSADLIATRTLSSTEGGSSSGGGGGGAGAPGTTCPDFVPTVSSGSSGEEGAVCAGWLGRRAFSHAVCSCGDLDVLAVLASDGRDSLGADPSAEPDRIGASIGVNGNYGGGEYVRIGGSFTVAGTAATASRGGIDVAGDLRLAPPTSAAGPIFVGRDAWLLQAASSLSLATVARDLNLGPNGALAAQGAVLVGGRTRQEPFDITAPCPCDAAELIDVGGIVDAGLRGNDNGRLGLTLEALSDVTSPQQRTLSCGRFALRRISGESAISLSIAGRVLLFVDGDVEAGRSFSLRLEPGAQLDWFIRGSLSLSGESLIGDDQRPAATRIYVLGDADITTPGTARFSANLYAPHARVFVAALGDVYGSVLGASVSSFGALLSRYDRAVLRADEDCAVPPPTQCRSCEQCGGARACVAGVCTACATDADCCFPFACQMGACKALNAE